MTAMVRFKPSLCLTKQSQISPLSSPGKTGCPGISLCLFIMVSSSNGNIFRVTGPLCGEFTGHRWIPLTKASGAGLWCFLWSALQQTIEKIKFISMLLSRFLGHVCFPTSTGYCGVGIPGAVACVNDAIRCYLACANNSLPLRAEQ